MDAMHRGWAGARSASRTIVRVRLSRGEIATGGWDPPERTDARCRRYGTQNRTSGDFLGVAGGKKKIAPVLRTG